MRIALDDKFPRIVRLVKRDNVFGLGNFADIDIAASGTRREELLLDPKEMELVVRLRKVVSDMSVVEAMELLRGRMGKTKSNAEFLMTMNLS